MKEKLNFNCVDKEGKLYYPKKIAGDEVCKGCTMWGSDSHNPYQGEGCQSIAGSYDGCKKYIRIYPENNDNGQSVEKQLKTGTDKTLYDRWVDTLKCPECGGNNFDIETIELNPIGEAIEIMLTRSIYCNICGFTFAKSERIDFINNERRRLYEKWQGKLKLSDLEMAEIS